MAINVILCVIFQGVYAMLSLLSAAKPDPILSLAKAYQQDKREHKIDLGIGVYKNEQGITPIMQAVKKAQLLLASTQETKSYVGLSGSESFNHLISELVLQNTHALPRSVTIQTPGASGALRMLAELIALANPAASVWISNPSYVNHQPVMQAAGLTVRTYPYLDTKTQLLDTDALLASLKQVNKGDIVLLHGACHNPTGVDMPLAVWREIASLAKTRGFIPFIDMAYHGLADGISQDLLGIEALADEVDELFISYSCSKNFGLYRERTGAAIVIAKDASIAQKAKASLLQLSRSSYTMPPDHGASIVELILTDEKLKKEWETELDLMRNRIQSLRYLFTKSLAIKVGDGRFDFINAHKGMFSMLGFTPKQIDYLRNEKGIYIVGDSRMNLAGLTESNIDYVADAIAELVLHQDELDLTP